MSDTTLHGQGQLVIGGKPVPISAPVRHDLEYASGANGVALRSRICDIGVLHWTGGEGPAPQVYAVLAQKRLSIHYVIDARGVIWQTCDPGLYRCAHAGPRANDRSVGIEVVDYGWVRDGISSPNSLRERYEAEIHGWSTTWADYLPCQYEALGELCDALSDALDIPRRVPTERGPHGPQLIARRLTSEELSVYSGWCGHLHVERLNKEHPKCDPGTRPLEWLGTRWRSRLG